LLLLAVAAPLGSYADAPTTGSDGYDLSTSRFAPPPESGPRGSSSGDELVLMFTGDNKLCGRTAQQIAASGPDYPFGLVQATLQSADLAFGNCEGAITCCARHTPGKSDAAIAAGQQFVFKSDPAYSGTIFSQAGYDVMQLANNHAMDYCAEGLQDTCSALDAAGIAHVGAGADYAAATAPVLVTAKGLRVGFLAYCMVIPPNSAAGRDRPGLGYLPAGYAAALKATIAGLRERCDLVVVGYHWGIEGQSVPSRSQRSIGRATIDAGADLVIGSHPHTFQGVEFYNGGLIAYSLGNFVFSGASPVIASGILRVGVDPAADGTRPRFSTAALLPCWVRNGRPEPSQAAPLRRQLNSVMQATGTRLTPGDAGWLLIEPAR
jgi:poly-gamma-glutamate synthesis protein (capsule biosynthesis protein)